MEKIHIFIDSVGDIPHEICDKYNIEVIPIYIDINGRTVREYYDITPQEYNEIIDKMEGIPTTAQITPSRFMELFKRAKDNGYTHVLGMVMSGQGSGTYQSACIAKEMFYDEYGNDMQIEVFDSESYAYIYGRIITEAAQMREAGEDFATIVAATKNRIRRIEGFLGIYSLKFVKKSGRISGGAAFIGEALGLKPFSPVYAGSVDVCDKGRGSKGLIQKMVENVIKRVANPESQTAYILTAITPEEDLALFEKLLYEKVGFKHVERVPLGPCITTNGGPRSVAVAFYGNPR